MKTVINNIPKEEKFDSLVLCYFEQDTNNRVKKWEQFLGVNINKIIAKNDSKKDMGNVLIMRNYDNNTFKSISLIFGEKEEKFTEEEVAIVASKITKTLGSKILIDVDSFFTKNMKNEEVAKIISETVTLKNYVFDELKSKKDKIEFDVTYYTEKNVGNGIIKGNIYGNATNNARTLVNRPYNHLDAEKLASYAIDLGKKYDIETQVFGLEEIRKLNMGAFLAVNQGSTAEPKLIVMKYQGLSEWKNVVGLIGKGLVFDSGGYSLKSNMVNMKTDMGGAAAVLGAMEIIAQIKPKKNVVLVIAATDNRINGHALLPDDVITASNGKTIEIISTDAEGRLTLADALQYAQKEGAKKVLDVATLTGGVVVALGNDITGYWTNSDAMKKNLVQSATSNRELIWELPIMEHIRKAVRGSKIADLLNSIGRPGTSLGAAAFLEEFINEGTEWVHLDIAGTASISSPNDFGPYGGTGVMVRTLADFVSND